MMSEESRGVHCRLAVCLLTLRLFRRLFLCCVAGGLVYLVQGRLRWASGMDGVGHDVDTLVNPVPTGFRSILRLCERLVADVGLVYLFDLIC